METTYYQPGRGYPTPTALPKPAPTPNTSRRRLLHTRGDTDNSIMAQPLHPNLARIGAAYDDIFQRWKNGQIDAATAHREISTLVARDDDGVLWTIDPASGSWMRRTLDGRTVADTPPAYGYATPTPHDLSTNDEAFNPDRHITFRRIDDEAMYAPSALSGLTRKPRVTLPTPRPSFWRLVAVIVAAALIVAVAFELLNR